MRASDKKQMMKNDGKRRRMAPSPFVIGLRRAMFRHSSFVIAGALLLWGCDVKDPVYETDHPEEAKITVTADWNGIGQGLTKPAGFKVAYGDEVLTATADKYTFPNLLAPGSYTVYFYNDAAEITVTGKTATVKTVAAGQLEPMPDWLFTGKLTATVEKDKRHEFTVQMAQQVRRLTLVIEPAGTTAERIKTITGTLSGVAGSYDMESGAHGSASSVALEFTKITTGTDAGKWTATVCLLGVTGSEQKLSGTIKFADGTPGDMPLESDLTAVLSNFNADKKTPLQLGGVVAESPDPAGFTATIKDWTKVSGSGTAN